MSSGVKLAIVGVVGVFLLIVSSIMFDVETIHGNEVGVLETWSGGVQQEPLQPKTYFLFPGFTQKVYRYDLSSQVFVMNDKHPENDQEYAKGRHSDVYRIQSKEGQNMDVSMNIRWRIDPLKVVHLHQTVRQDFEEKLIRPVLMRVVKDAGTKREAIAAYSGEGLVALQAEIYKNLIDKDGELAEAGVVIENFVIEGIRLDEEYIGQIKKRQVSVQGELRANQETKTATAEAQKAKADAQADFEKTLVEARRDKEVKVLAAEANAEQEVLAAGAAAKRQVLAATAEKDAGELRGAGILAVGKATAEAKKLELSAYAVPGADSFVKIEVAKHMAEAFQNIKGYLPESMKINVLSGSFSDGIKSVVAGNAASDK